MDKIVEKIASLGVPGLVLVIAINATGLSGGAAIITALAALGPGGIVGGLLTLGVLGIIAEGVVKYGIDNIFSAVVSELCKRGETKESIWTKIQKYPISKDLKRNLKESLDIAEHTVYISPCD